MSAKNTSLEASVKDSTASIDIKVPALLAGTVTSVIVAVLASRLGVQGTLLGAALTSLVFGLISPFLTFGFQRSHEGLKIVAARRLPADPDAPGPAAAEPTEVVAQVALTTPRARRRVPLGVAAAGVVATALVTFGATVGVVTALETAAGRSVDGSYSTTVSGLSKPDATATTTAPVATTTTDPDASSLNAQGTATPSVAPSATASATATESAPATPAATAAPTAPQTTDVPAAAQTTEPATTQAG